MAMAPNVPQTLQPQPTGGAYARPRGLSVSEVDRENLGLGAGLGAQNPYSSVRSRRVSISAGGGEDIAAKVRTRKMSSAAAQNPYGTPGQALQAFYDDGGQGQGLPTGKSPYVRPGSLPQGAWVGQDGRVMVQNPALTGGSHNAMPLAPQITGGAASVYASATGGQYGASPGSTGRIVVPTAFYREPDRHQVRGGIFVTTEMVD